MHELSIALSILDAAGEEAHKHGDVRVRAVHLKLGPLAGVVKEALVSAFEMARADTPLADADLVIEDIPVRIRCSQCRADRPIVSLQEFACAECGTASADVVQGRELELVALEVE
jgi:hydrogenase nickel incorporation protein HypA/HybF